jgi:subtilase family serine protease
VEELETRTLLSGSGLGGALLAHPAVSVVPDTFNPTPVGLTPTQVRTAYGFKQISFSPPGGGTPIKGDGTGQTVAIVDAYDDPFIASDLKVFSRTWHLAAPNLIKIDQRGNAITNRTDVANDQGWAFEISLDVETVHALAPGATIMLVEADSNFLSDLFTAVQTAASQPNVSVVSMSWSIPEAFLGDPTGYDTTFTTPTGHTPVSFVASSADDGGFFGPDYPASSPNVLSVGGTTLTLGTNNRYGSETAWFYSGGGQSYYEPEPGYQNGVQTSGYRQVPDVAFDADPASGPAIYDSFGYGDQSGWFQIGGTSFSAPSWAALLGVVNQGRAINGLGALGNAQAAVYSLPSGDFHDITTGNNYYNSAGPGYDLVTGLGTPRAQLVARDLSTIASPTFVLPAPTGSSQVPSVTVNRGEVLTSPVGATLVNASVTTAAPVTLAGTQPLAVAPAAPVGLTAHAQPVGLELATALTTGQPLPAESGTRSTGTVDTAPTGAVLVAPDVAPAALPQLPAVADDSEACDAVFAADAPAVLASESAVAAVLVAGEAKVTGLDTAALAGLAVVLGGCWQAQAPQPRTDRRRSPRL